jgi:NAD(P)-dependent dehydrogenase (short-subunit alcohol dehydrogenase family)
MEIKNKSILITGAGRRIGRTLAVALAARGARIGIHYNRSKAEAEALAKEIEDGNGQAALIAGDISNTEDCGRIIEDAVKGLGGLHVLINNASVFFKTPLFQTTEKEWDQLVDTNLKGPFFCSQAAAKAMPDNGKIINIADWAAFRPYTHYLPYCISKAGLIAMTEGLARTLAPKITVNAIALGAMILPEGSDENEKSTLIKKTPMKRIGSPDDVVNAVLYLLEGGDFITGSTLVVDGGQRIA